MPTLTDEPKASASPTKSFRTWKLAEAKARLSELVKQAGQEPQRITVSGKDAVMVVSVEEFAQMHPSARQPNLHQLLAHSPLADLEFDRQSQRSPVRDTGL